MFCLRARIVLSGVSLCALVTGCSTANHQPQSAVALNTQPRQGAIYSDVDATSTIRPVSREDIIGWSIRGTSDDVIIDRLQHSPAVFHLTTGEEIHLRDAGVSDEVVRAMKATAG